MYVSRKIVLQFNKLYSAIEIFTMKNVIVQTSRKFLNNLILVNQKSILMVDDLRRLGNLLVSVVNLCEIRRAKSGSFQLLCGTKSDSGIANNL